jgi:predicted CopG family antitoxin
MVALGTVTVRLPLDVLERFQKEAKDSGKTVSDVIRERLTSTEMPAAGTPVTETRLEELKKLLEKAVKAAAASQFYAREGTLEGSGIAKLSPGAKRVHKASQDKRFKNRQFQLFCDRANL